MHIGRRGLHCEPHPAKMVYKEACKSSPFTFSHCSRAFHLSSNHSLSIYESGKHFIGVGVTVLQRCSLKRGHIFYLKEHFSITSAGCTLNSCLVCVVARSPVRFSSLKRAISQKEQYGCDTVSVIPSVCFPMRLLPGSI